MQDSNQTYNVTRSPPSYYYTYVIPKGVTIMQDSNLTYYMFPRRYYHAHVVSKDVTVMQDSNQAFSVSEDYFTKMPHLTTLTPTLTIQDNESKYYDDQLSHATTENKMTKYQPLINDITTSNLTQIIAITQMDHLKNPLKANEKQLAMEYSTPQKN